MTFFRIFMNCVFALLAITLSISILALLAGYLDGRKLNASCVKKQNFAEGVYKQNALYCKTHKYLYFCKAVKT